MTENAQQPGENKPMRLRYEQSAALLASQFVVNLTENGILLDCSSGPILDETSRQPVLPIHTRIAIPQAGVRRLLQLLSRVTNSPQCLGETAATTAAAGAPTDESGARLPRLTATDA